MHKNRKMQFFQMPKVHIRMSAYAFVAAALWIAATGVPAHAQDDAPPALGWSGEIALGGSISTGNTDRQALDLDARAKFNTEHREDRYKLLGDLSQENGQTTAERAEVAAQTNYDIAKDKFYVLGFTGYRRDRFSGFRYEAEVGPGVGYRFVRNNRLEFFVEFAPGYRHGEVSGSGRDDDLIFARGTINIAYQLSDNAKLANEALLTGDAQRLKTENTFSVTSTLIRSLAARVSLNMRYNSNPPIGVRKTDTLTKVSLVYAFK
jgi:putative salt-induced outer membrane protein